MTRALRQKVIQSIYFSLATEVESHLANGSGFIFEEPGGYDSPQNVIDLRVKVVKQVVAYLFKKAGDK